MTVVLACMCMFLGFCPLGVCATIDRNRFPNQLSVNASGGMRKEDNGVRSWASRVVSVADLHGDLGKAKSVLRAAKLVDKDGNWCAERQAPNTHTVLVQTGDLMDRGPESLALLRYFKKLRAQAQQAGDQVINLLGNHEIMNLDQDLRYVNPVEKTKYGGRSAWNRLLAPKSELGEFIRSFPVLHVVANTLFCHAGLLLPDNGGGKKGGLGGEISIEEINGIASESLHHTSNRKSRAKRGISASVVLRGRNGPLWTRALEDLPEAQLCRRLAHTFERLNIGRSQEGKEAIRRMVIGHNAQPNQKPRVRCGGMLILMDVGMSRAYGDGFAALEIENKYDSLPLGKPTSPASTAATAKQAQAKHHKGQRQTLRVYTQA